MKGTDGGVSRRERRLDRRDVLAGLLVVVAACGVILPGLGASTFHDGDEALYTQIAREMTRSGDFLTPRYWDAPFLHKPPLQYWLIAAADAAVPGPRELRARAPSAVASIALVVAVFATGLRLGGRYAGVGAALLVLLNNQFLFEHVARSANLDAIAVFLGFIALVAGGRSREGVLPRAVSAVCLAALTLQKGPVAFFAFAPVLVYLLAIDRRIAMRWLGWVAGAMILIALPWHLHQLAIHGRKFWDTYVLYEILGRAGATADRYSPHRLVHLEAFWRSFLPWSPVIAVGTLAAALRWPRNDRPDPSPGLLAGYAVLLFGVLAAVPAKWPWYGVPAYPALAVVGAVFVADLLRTRWAAVAPLLLGLPLAARVLLLDPDGAYAPSARRSVLWPGEVTYWRPAEAMPGPAEMVLALLVVAAATVALVPRFRRSRGRLAALTVGLAAIGFAVSAATVAGVPRVHDGPSRELGAYLESRDLGAVYLFGFPRQSRYDGRIEPIATYYLHGDPRCEVVDSGDDLEGVTSRDGRGIAVVVHAQAMSSRGVRDRLSEVIAREGPGLEVWILQPESGGSFGRFSGREPEGQSPR